MTTEQHEERLKQQSKSLEKCFNDLKTETVKLWADNQTFICKIHNLEELLNSNEVTLTEEGKRRLSIIKRL